MRKRWKRSFVTALAMALAVGNCVPAMAATTGWKKDASGWTYVNANGSVQKGWLKDKDGKWYFLDYKTGVMKTGWIKPKDGKWYFLDYKTGAMRTSWIKPMDGKWYYLNPTNGDMQSGWVQTPDKKWYYMDSSGAMQTGKITVGNQVWTLDANGAWDGKSATTAFVSSSLPSGSRNPSGGGSSGGEDKDTIPATVTKNTDLEALAKKYNTTSDRLAVTIDAPDITLTGSEGANKIASLTISDKVGDNNVTIENVEIIGTTTVGGGGGNTVNFKKCTLNNVVTKKLLGTEILHIDFGVGTTVKKEVRAEDGTLQLTTAIDIPTLVTKIPIEVKATNDTAKVKTFEVDKNSKKNMEIKLDAPVDSLTTSTPIILMSTGEEGKKKGKIENIKVTESTETFMEITLNVPVTLFTTAVSIGLKGNSRVDNVKADSSSKIKVVLDVDTGAITSNRKIDLTTTSKSQNVKLPPNKEIVEKFEGVAIDGYYKVTLNATDGYWEVNNKDNKTKDIVVKMGDANALKNALVVADRPTNDSDTFEGWYTLPKNGNLVSENPGDEIKEVFAHWTKEIEPVKGVTITGERKVGKRLSVTIDPTNATTPSYSWEISDNNKDYKEVSNGSYYDIAPEDIGKFIRVTVTAGGAKKTATVQVDKTEVKVEKAEIAGAVDGKVTVGKVLTAVANNGVTGILTYEWQISNTGEDGSFEAIPRETNDIYTVKKEDAGKYIKVLIKGNNNGNLSEKLSNYVKVKEVEVTEAKIEIDGTVKNIAKVGNELTAVANTDATGKLTYEWQISDTGEDGSFKEIKTEKGKTYIVKDEAEGKYIRVIIRGANNSSKSSDSVKIEKVSSDTPPNTPTDTTLPAGTVKKAVNVTGSAATLISLGDAKQDGNKVTIVVTTGDSVKVDTDKTVKVDNNSVTFDKVQLSLAEGWALEVSNDVNNNNLKIGDTYKVTLIDKKNDNKKYEEITVELVEKK